MGQTYTLANRYRAPRPYRPNRAEPGWWEVYDRPERKRLTIGDAVAAGIAPREEAC